MKVYSLVGLFVLGIGAGTVVVPILVELVMAIKEAKGNTNK